MHCSYVGSSFDVSACWLECKGMVLLPSNLEAFQVQPYVKCPPFRSQANRPKLMSGLRSGCILLPFHLLARPGERLDLFTCPVSPVGLAVSPLQHDQRQKGLRPFIRVAGCNSRAARGAGSPLQGHWLQLGHIDQFDLLLG